MYSTTAMYRTFLYFAYGSNLLSQRIHINNPTAVNKDIGKLENFRLDFNYQSKRWKGAVATIVPTENSHVWGVVWEINEIDLPNLDEQEGVHDNIYFPLTVNVQTPNGTVLECRVYQQCNNPKDVCPLSALPENRQPSQIYLNTILKGAAEHRLPKDYIELLKSIKHNGYNEDIDISRVLN